MENHVDDLDVKARLKELSTKYTDLNQRCLNTSANRLAREAARLARENHLLIPYLWALFRLMNSAQGQNDPEAGKQAALEVISYLESPDRARSFQSDVPENEYAEIVGWMSACAYDNLATHIASMHGYNSEGMHQCITDGINICRRTGKLRCLTCFREYASNVYLASDDLTMAVHFARMVRSMPENAPNSERRWVGAKEETWMLLLVGDLQGAEQSAHDTLKLAETYHTPLHAKIRTLQLLETIALLLGQHGEYRAQFGQQATELAIPRGESIDNDLDSDENAALHACCERDFQKAEEILVHWDRWLTDHGNLNGWFDVRLRLIACHRLAGNQNRLEPLARQLSDKAWQARDWLTLHRLSRLMDPAEAPSPLALLGPLAVGPFAAADPSVSIPAKTSEPAPSVPDASAAPPAAAEEKPPLDDAFKQLVERLNSLQDDASRQALLGDVLAIPTASVTHALDAARLLHFLTFIQGDDPTAIHRATWTWAESIAAPCPRTAVVLNLLAVLGDLLRRDEAMRETITADQVERGFRASMDLDPFDARNHFRAGLFYLGQENLGEAERCLARGFRLERNFSPLAQRLAEIYDRTERPRDALMVLDTCLREGCDDPAVAWQASLSAVNLNQHEPLLAYLDRHEQLQPGALWIHYYRAVGLLELGRPQEALAAIEEETRRAPQHKLPLLILRACALQLLDRQDEARLILPEILGIRLAGVDYLTFNGLANLFARLWKTVAVKLAADDAQYLALEQHLLAAGLAPDELFEPHRQREEARDGIHFFRCMVRQPLDETWPSSPGCLAGQGQWPEYLALWGVLAVDEDEARQRAQTWQARCGHPGAEARECEMADDTYRDRPGIVWQGQRWYAPASG
jgi:tetratricopeptide (TPR) repeat protein